MKNKLMVLLVSLVPVCSLAGTKPIEIKFENGEIFKVRLSKYDFNRLHVKGEKIIKARYSEGSYKVDESVVEDEEDDDGAVYLKPAQKRISTMYLSTDKGHTFGIEGVQEDEPGKSLDFVFGKKNIHPKRRVNNDVLHQVRLDKVPDGYVRVYDEKRVAFLNKSLKANLLSHFKRGDKEVYKYQIKNVSNKPTNIPYKLVKTESVLRYFIEKTQLASGASTVLVSLVSTQKEKSHV